MAVVVIIVLDEGLQTGKAFAQPFGSSVVLLYEECRMLCQTGLVHICLVDVSRLYLVRI